MAESEPGTRDQIVTATRKLIEDRGIAHGTTKKIAQAAGCAEGTIFRYFARKEDLLLAAVLANFPTFKESLMSISEGTPSQRLHRLGLNVIPFFEQSTQAAVAVLSDAELTRRHREIVRERHGGMRTDISPVHIASTLLGPCFFRVFTRLSLTENAPELSDEDFVAGVVEALWEGVRLAGSKPMRDLSTTSPISASTLWNLRRPGNACGALCSTLIACPATSSHRPISWPGHRSSSWSGVPDKGG